MSARLIGSLAAMVALLSAGLATGGRIYYALFLVLVLMVVFALISVVWTLFTVRVTMKGVKPRVVRGDKLMTILTVEHRSLLPAGSLRVTLNVPGGVGGRQELSVEAPPFAKRNFRNVIRCPHRGNYEVGVAKLSAEDIFGLFEFSRKSGKKLMRVEVCPRVNDAPVMQLKPSDVGPEFRSRATEDAASPSDIRKWQDGDELKKVHWKLSMRKRELMVRTFEESARPDTLIIPDLSEITALRDQKLTLEDYICEVALSAAKAQLDAGFPVRMPLQSRRPRELSGRMPADVASFAEALMRVEFDSTYPYEQILMLMFQRMQRTGGAVLVTSRVSTRTVDIALRMQQRGIQVKLIWITDAARDDAREMLERLKMAGAIVETVDPWAQEGFVPETAPGTASGEANLFEM
ncbi:MAG: DUF58 domain-containing protein [Clostridia bacterium]|nr:DUF58 domain-containing protein [Clostridia bacterium]